MHDAPPLHDHRAEHDGPPPDTSVKVAHLVFALLFLGTAGTWALVAGHVITAERLPVLLPALLIAAGVVGLVATGASSRHRRRSGATGSTGSTTSSHGPAGTTDRDADTRVLGDPDDLDRSTDSDDGTEPTQVLR